MSIAFSASGGSSLPIYYQAEIAECGLVCLAMVATSHGYEADMPTMRRRFKPSSKGMTLRKLIEIGAALGLNGRALRCELEDLKDVKLPAILHWGTNHFVVLKSATKRHLIIHDPSQGKLTVPIQSASKLFTGIVLELDKLPQFQSAKIRSRLRIRDLVNVDKILWRSLGQVVTLAICFELLVLAAPFYMQIVIDEVVISGDRDLLIILASCFGFVAFMKALSALLRDLSKQYIANNVAFELKGNVFSKILTLPLDWFQRRQVADIQSRLWAVRPIQNFVSQGALTGILDGVLGTIVLAVMLFYSWRLSLIVFSFLFAYAVIRLMSLSLVRRYAADAIATDAREQTRLLETLRAAQTIKAAAAEPTRAAQYKNAVAASIKSQTRSGNINLGGSFVSSLLSGVTDVFVIFMGAKLVIADSLTIGMLTAFVAYKGHLVGRYTSFIEQIIAWNLLHLHLGRIEDIVRTDSEVRLDRDGYSGLVVGEIRCSNVSFCYSPSDPLVISNLSLSIDRGECVAIVGASGCGKSTLAKLLVGLYSPVGGDVMIDGRKIDYWNKRALRSQIGYVSQDDSLLSGTLAENIAFFDELIDMDRVQRCAVSASVNADILAMPMAYETLVGDMGSSLSGGQKQRVLLARALYRDPKILVMDEATAHLDIETELKIIHNLRDLSITRIMIAHRPDTINGADRVISLDRRDYDEQLSKLMSGIVLRK